MNAGINIIGIVQFPDIDHISQDMRNHSHAKRLALPVLYPFVFKLSISLRKAPRKDAIFIDITDNLAF